jgi:hypothetical protein
VASRMRDSAWQARILDACRSMPAVTPDVSWTGPCFGLVLGATQRLLYMGALLPRSNAAIAWRRGMYCQYILPACQWHAL